jgi:Putative Ig domain/Ricin-type beta-trefoil lectin domain/Subtilase family
MRAARRRRGLVWRVATVALALPLGLTVASTATGLAATRPAAARPPASVTAVPRAGLIPQRQRPARLPGGVRQACAAPARPGQMACLALLPARQHGLARPDNVTPDIYGPADLQSAYNLTSAAAGRGSGETVAVVDAYNDPRAAADLAVYRSQWHLPACDHATGAGCVTVVNEHGAADRLPPADPTGGWETEESLDMDMVSAICPNCHILLVEANSASTTDLGTAEDTAVRLGAKFISDSWGGGGSAADNAYFDHPGVAITAAAGDYGYGTSYPASAQFVTSVGGTTLVPAPHTARGWQESAWNLTGGFPEGTGSGCATDPDASAKPAWQTVDDNAATGCLNRTDNDVSAVADPNTPVWFYDSYPYLGQKPDWSPVGGTSVASPIVAAVYALAGTPQHGTYPGSYLYQAGHAAHLYPVTSGFDGYCKPAYLCNAADDYPGTSYNGPAGWGTPDGTAAFTDTAAGDTITVTDPGTQDRQAGTTFRLPVSAADSAAGQKLTFSATGLPAGLTINPATGLISGRLPAAPRTSKITITAADTTGAAGSVSFDLVALPNLRAAYHKVTGPVTLHTLSHPATLCLYDARNSAASGTKVEVWKCDGQVGERWTYLPDPVADSSGTLVIHGKCAMIVHQGPKPGLRLRHCDGAPSQKWSLQFGAVWLYNPASGLCMNDPHDSTRDGTQVSVATCEDTVSQAFTLPPGPVLSGIAGQCLTDPRNSRHAGIRLDAIPCNGSRAQLWSTFSSWTEPDHNGLCMDTTGYPYTKPGVQPGVPVLLTKCAGGIDTLWFPLPDGQIINADNGLCLDNPGSAAAQAAKLVMEPCYGSAGEIWAEG